MAWHAYRADMRIKTIDTGKRVRSHCSYLVNTVELCFYNTLEVFVFLTHYVPLFPSHGRILNKLSAYFVTSVCQLLLWEWFCWSILLTEYKRKWRKSTFLFESFNKKRKTLRQITALSLGIFTINTVILFLVAILRLHSYQICIK